jgi:hypothetical protein
MIHPSQMSGSSLCDFSSFYAAVRWPVMTLTKPSSEVKTWAYIECMCLHLEMLNTFCGSVQNSINIGSLITSRGDVGKTVSVAFF